MHREAWRAAIHGIAKSRTRLSHWTELNWKICCCIFGEYFEGKYKLFCKYLVEFICEAISSLTFFLLGFLFCFVFLNYRFNFINDNWSVDVFCFFGSVLGDYFTFLRICSFFLGQGFSQPLDLMSDDLRWNWCNNNRNKVHNTCNMLKLSPNHSSFLLQSMKKLSSTKLTSGSKKIGDCCSGVSVLLAFTHWQ